MMNNALVENGMVAEQMVGTYPENMAEAMHEMKMETKFQSEEIEDSVEHEDVEEQMALEETVTADEIKEEMMTVKDDDVELLGVEVDEEADTVNIEYRMAGSIEKRNISWSCKQATKMVKGGTMRFDHIVQRSLVWEKSRKSGLIESIILGFPVPPVWAKQRVAREDEITSGRSNKVYDILDGKQRLNTIAEFISDEFALTELCPIGYENDFGELHVVNISGMKFSELPEELQDTIKDMNISVNYFDGLSKEEERELFKRLNAGKPLSTKSNLLASCKDIEGMLDIGSHKLFDEMLTAKAKANKNQVSIVMKVWCMLNQDINNVSFESKTFNPMVENTKITETEKLAMVEVFNFIYDVHANLVERKEKKVAKKVYTETHLVSLIPYFKKAIETGIEADMMADWIMEFFGTINGASVSERYNDCAGSGVAKSMNIIGRNDALEESYAEFFKMDIIEENVEKSFTDFLEDMKI